MAILQESIKRLRFYWKLLVYQPVESYTQNADAADAARHSIVLSFSLSRVQRVVNPCERLIWVICGVSLMAIGLLALIQSPWAWPPWALALFLWGFVFKMFRRPIISFGGSLIGNAYINRVQFTEDFVACGFNTLTARMPRRHLRVSKGWLGTYLLSHPYGYTVVIPREAIAFDELKRLLS
jgi:hypothetical protein